MRRVVIDFEDPRVASEFLQWIQQFEQVYEEAHPNAIAVVVNTGLRDIDAYIEVHPK